MDEEVKVEVRQSNSDEMLKAAAAASVAQLDAMRREIAELEAQMGNMQREETQIPCGGGAGHLLYLSGRVLVCYSLFGLCQEYLVKIVYEDQMGWYITFVQFSYYTSFALAQRKWGSPCGVGVIPRGDKAWERTVPWSYYFILGGLQAICLGMSNVSVQYLSYPTHILFKSSTPILRLVYGSLMQGKRYVRVDYIGILLMCAGLSLLLVADARAASMLQGLEDKEDEINQMLINKMKQQSSYMGLLLVALALCCEVIIGLVQEKILRKLNASQDELVLYTHFVGTFFALFLGLVTGELFEGIQVTSVMPSIMVPFMMLSTSGYYGITSLNTLVKHSGPFPALLTTTSRKIVGVALSVLVFPKIWLGTHSAAAALFMLGTFLSSPASQMKLRAWCGHTFLAPLLQLDAKRARALRALR